LCAPLVCYSMNDNKVDYITQWKMPCGLTLRGYSKAAEATYLFVPELKISLDMGGIDKTVKSNLFFITHTHSDHAIHLPEAQPAFIDLKDPNIIFAPKQAVKYIHTYMHASQELNSNADLNSEEVLKQKPFQVIGVSPSETYPINHNKHEVAVFFCQHNVTSVGYGFSEVRMKLKDEYKSVPGKEIAALRKQGVEVQERTLVPLFLFLGDTNAEVFTANSETMFSYPVIILECTFILPNHLNQASNSFHLHWSDIEPFVHKYPNVTFVLIHFSLRYKDDEIQEFFANLKLPNVVPWLTKKQ